MKAIVELQQDGDTGDLYFQLPEQVLNQVGWSEGDTLEWFDNGDNSWSIRKAKPAVFKLVPNDEGYVLMYGDNYSLAQLSDLSFNFEPKYIEKILNLGHLAE
jgi:bifunctional DNA-binding transcriptional regulator/antitoxin component of YhaV-PrlF toxin-antitoxin module